MGGALADAGLSRTAAKPRPFRSRVLAASAWVMADVKLSCFATNRLLRARSTRRAGHRRPLHTQSAIRKSEVRASMGRFDGKVGFVSGGGTGIGFACAKAIVDGGGQVVVAG